MSSERSQTALIRQKYKEKLIEFNTRLLAARTELEEAKTGATSEVLEKGKKLVMDLIKCDRHVKIVITCIHKKFPFLHV